MVAPVIGRSVPLMAPVDSAGSGGTSVTPLDKAIEIIQTRKTMSDLDNDKSPEPLSDADATAAANKLLKYTKKKKQNLDNVLVSTRAQFEQYRAIHKAFQVGKVNGADTWETYAFTQVGYSTGSTGLSEGDSGHTMLTGYLEVKRAPELGVQLALDGVCTWGGTNATMGMDKGYFGLAGPKNDSKTAIANRCDIFNASIGWGSSSNSLVAGVVELDPRGAVGNDAIKAGTQGSFAKYNPGHMQTVGAMGNLGFDLDHGWKMVLSSSAGYMLGQLRLLGDNSGIGWETGADGSKSFGFSGVAGFKWSDAEAAQLNPPKAAKRAKNAFGVLGHYAKMGDVNVFGAYLNAKVTIVSDFALATNARVYSAGDDTNWALHLRATKTIGPADMALGGAYASKSSVVKGLSMPNSGGDIGGSGIVGQFDYPNHASIAQAFLEGKVGKTSVILNYSQYSQANGDTSIAPIFDRGAFMVFGRYDFE